MPITKAQYEQLRAAEFLHAINAALQRGHGRPIEIEGYCEGPKCPTREVKLFVKDYDHELKALVEKNGLRCPVCGQQLKPHNVLTLEELNAKSARLARMSVNTQRYERRTGSCCVPANVLLDDTLPE